MSAHLIKGACLNRCYACGFAASFILRLVYGLKLEPASNDDLIARIHQKLQNVERSMRRGAYLVEFLPFLKWIPGYGRKLKEYHNYEMQLYREQMERVRSEMVSMDPFSKFIHEGASGKYG